MEDRLQRAVFGFQGVCGTMIDNHEHLSIISYAIIDLSNARFNYTFYLISFTSLLLVVYTVSILEHSAFMHNNEYHIYSSTFVPAAFKESSFIFEHNYHTRYTVE